MRDLPILELQSCSAGYGNRRVFTGVDVAIHPGEILAVVGASGVGKTTLLHVMAGLKAPDRGSVLLAGEPLTDTDSRIGVVFQDHSLFPWMTVAANVSVGLRIRGVGRRERERRAAAVMRDLAIEDCGDFYPPEISGGQRQRAALARTLLLDPAVVLLDEPFSSLDALTRERLQQLTRDRLADLAGVIVTHDTEEAVFLGRRLAVLGSRDADTDATLLFVDNPAYGSERTSGIFIRVRRRLREMLTEVSHAPMD